MERITSAKNPLVRQLRALNDRKGREASGMLLVEGAVMIDEALRCGLTPGDAVGEERCADALQTLAERGARVAVVPRGVLEAVCDTRTPQGVCASFSAPRPLSLSDAPNRVVALDGVQDPGNVGTIWRTADAAGFGAVLFGPGCADPLSPKVQRAAMGSGFRVPFMAAEEMSGALRALRARGFCVLASDLRGADFYDRPEAGERFALVIGSEARGISQATREAATALVKLPMRGGAESLNAAVAAGIMMYEMARGEGSRE